MSARTKIVSRIARTAAALALAAAVTAPVAAHAEEFHDIGQGNPFHLVGHLLAPVGNAFGFLVVEPVFWVFDHVPALFQLK